MNALPNSANKVQQALNQAGLDLNVVELPTCTRTAQEAATAIGCSVAQIVKSLVFRGQISKKPILILVSGTNRVNEKAASQLIGEPLAKAKADFVRAKTGFAIGGIPPLGHLEKIDTYIDHGLLTHETIWAAAGTPNAVFRLNPHDLTKVTDGVVITVT